MTLKHILVILIFFAYDLSFGQSPAFKSEWDTIQKRITHLDTLANVLSKQKERFRSRKQILHFYNLNDESIKHCVVIKYKNGNITARHQYRRGKELCINVLTVNGKQVYIKTMYRQQIIKSSLSDKGIQRESRFLHVGNDKWYWTRKTSESNIKRTVEVINNWH